MAKEPSKTPELQQWLTVITTYEKQFKKWETRVEKIEKRYRDEQSQVARPNATAKFNILWSNVQTIVPAVFSRLPKRDCARGARGAQETPRMPATFIRVRCPSW